MIQTILPILLFIIGIVGWWLGGQGQKPLRTVVVPLILALYFSLIYWDWRLLALFASYSVIRLGYGAWDPNDDKPSTIALILATFGYKDTQGKVIRSVWATIVSLVAPLPLFIWGYIGIPHYILYLGLNVVINYSVCEMELPVIPTDISVASGILSILFIHFI